MRFCPNEPPDHNKGERLVWNLLRRAFEGDEGVGYYRYPVFAGRGSRRHEPDFLVVHRKFGIWVFECKGARIENIAEINGQEWAMRRWYDETIYPVQQADDQLFAVKGLVERDRELRRLGIPFEYRVLLPFVQEAEWAGSPFAENPSCLGVVLVGEQLERAALRAELTTHGLAEMPELTDEQWEQLKGVFRGEVTDRTPRAVPDRTPTESPLRIIHAVESRLRQLDEAQERVAHEAPEGPQRIRGLAGTGKTVLFAKRAARLHAAHPDWNIAFVFFTRALYQQVRGQVEQQFRSFTGECPDPGRLRIWHAWGGKDVTGFLRELALAWEQRPLTLNDVKQAIGNAAYSGGFAWACAELERRLADAEVEPFLDALLIDEGQDLPPAFYRLARRALRPPHRLYWAYDEAQGIGNLIVPRAAELFGTDEAGRPRVDLAGSYVSGIPRAHNLNRCYRTPARILAVAHAFNMGLRREGGPLQGVTQQTEWENLGYRVTGDFGQASVAAGRDVVLERDPEACGHPFDDAAFRAGADRDAVLRIEAVADERAMLEALVAGIRADLGAGLEPHDLLVVPLPDARPTVRTVLGALEKAGIPVIEAGGDPSRETFLRTGCVTVSNIYRAKGNEAWKVYALGLHAACAEHARDVDDELVRRNQAFVALTRATLWRGALGTEGPALTELRALAAEAPRITFRAFNQRSLRRQVGHEELEQGALF